MYKFVLWNDAVKKGMIWILTKDTNSNRYRFYDLGKNEIKEMSFKTPREAMDWLDDSAFEWDIAE